MSDLFILIFLGVLFWLIFRKLTPKLPKVTSTGNGIPSKDYLHTQLREDIKKKYDLKPEDCKNYVGYTGAKTVASLEIYKNAKKLVYDNSYDGIINVYDLEKITRVEIREKYATTTRDSLMSDSINHSSLIEKVSLLIMIKDETPIDFYLFDYSREIRLGILPGLGQEQYPKAYAKAVELKSLLEELSGISINSKPATTNATPAISEELQQLVQLKEQGILNEEEFTKAKMKLLA